MASSVRSSRTATLIRAVRETKLHERAHLRDDGHDVAAALRWVRRARRTALQEGVRAHLRDDGGDVAAALGDVALDAAREAHVVVAVDKDLHVRALQDGRKVQCQDAFNDDDLR